MIYHLFKVPIGKVVFLVPATNSVVEIFKKNKKLVFSGTRDECLLYHGNTYPDSPIKELH